MSGDFYCEFVLNHKIEVRRVKESEALLAFHHTRPSYPLHIVIVPKQHIEKLSDLQDLALIQEVFALAVEMIKELKLDETNFRIITNGGSFQDSRHLHFHLVSDERI